VDAMMKGLFGGDDDRERTRDFVQRYETGDPTEGYSSEEAYQQYDRVSRHLSPEEYQDAAEQAFSRMRPDQRSQFAQMMQQQMGGRGGSFQATDDPRQLAQSVAQYRQQDQGGLGSLFGGGGGGSEGGLGGMLGGLLGGGDDDRGRTRSSLGGGGGGMGGMFDNPLAKAALGGIAAMAVKKMINNR